MSDDVASTLAAAFEAAAATAEARSSAELDIGVAPALTQLGFIRFGGVDVAPGLRGTAHRVRPAFGAAISDWIVHRDTHGMAAADPVHDEVTRSAEPFLWSELDARRGGLNRRERETLNSAQAFGIGEVLTVPEHRPGGGMGAVHLVARKEVSFAPQQRTAAHLIAVYYAAAARRLEAGPARGLDLGAVSTGPLSERQIECLRWVRDGKSATDIAAILKLSRRTVEDHIAVACKRLGVRTRVQAVAVALMQGLLGGVLMLMAQLGQILDIETGMLLEPGWLLFLPG